MKKSNILAALVGVSFMAIVACHKNKDNGFQLLAPKAPEKQEEAKKETPVQKTEEKPRVINLEKSLASLETHRSELEKSGIVLTETKDFSGNHLGLDEEFFLKTRGNNSELSDEMIKTAISNSLLDINDLLDPKNVIKVDQSSTADGIERYLIGRTLEGGMVSSVAVTKKELDQIKAEQVALKEILASFDSQSPSSEQTTAAKADQKQDLIEEDQNPDSVGDQIKAVYEQQAQEKENQATAKYLEESKVRDEAAKEVEKASPSEVYPK